MAGRDPGESVRVGLCLPRVVAQDDPDPDDPGSQPTQKRRADKPIDDRIEPVGTERGRGDAKLGSLLGKECRVAPSREADDVKPVPIGPDDVERLRAIGIPARAEQVVTSAVATADYVSRRYPASTPLYIIGDDGIRTALAERGFREDPPNAQVVVVGLDFAATFDKLKLATLRIRAGALPSHSR